MIRIVNTDDDWIIFGNVGLTLTWSNKLPAEKCIGLCTRFVHSLKSSLTFSGGLIYFTVIQVVNVKISRSYVDRVSIIQDPSVKHLLGEAGLLSKIMIIEKIFHAIYILLYVCPMFSIKNKLIFCEIISDGDFKCIQMIKAVIIT